MFEDRLKTAWGVPTASIYHQIMLTILENPFFKLNNEIVIH